MDQNTALELFTKLYGKEGNIQAYHSPGRVNLIGEHTDYNGGYVFPCALSLGIYGIARKREDNIVNLASANFDVKAGFSLENVVYEKEHDWINYPKGMIKQLLDLGLGEKIKGADIFVAGNLPNGAGLSSSASLELLTCVVFNDLFSLNLGTKQMAGLAQMCENEFIGVNCGIMDQFIVSMGKKDYALMLDCMKMKYEYVPINLEGYKVIISNTNKRRELADSKYNERRSECEKAVEYLKKKLDINLLGDISIKDFNENKHLIEDDTIRKRAEHVVYENERVIMAVDKLKENDIKAFGKLMIESHNSLRDLYEVTGIELDTLVSEALQISGTVGSRMTGAGFGGCTVSIVENEYVQEFTQRVGENYKKITGLTADFFVVETSDGTRKLS